MGLVEAMGFPEGPAKDFKKSMLLSHGRDEYRKRIRQALIRAVGPSTIEKQRPMIRRLVKTLLQDLDSKDDIDLLNDFAFLLPASLFCQWFGAPISDARWVAELSDRILKIFSNDPKYTPEIIAAYDELFPYVQKRIDAALESPQDNLLGHFVDERQAGNLSEEELFHIVSMFNEASTDNTAHGIATAIGEIIGDADRWQQIVKNPELIPAAITENMRLSGRINTLVRFASEAFEYNDVSIPNGTAVHFVIPAAHRDPTVYENPLQFDPTRKDVHNILDFGGGAYTCLGLHVAMIEIQEALAELASNFSATVVKNFAVNTNIFINEVSELKVDLKESRA
jgi:cytochrome P450